MNIETRYLVEGSKEAEGLVVIIDVLRACTTIPILFKQGARKIIPVLTPEDALEYGKLGYVLVGEGEHGHKHDAFHHINSPSEVYKENFSGKDIVLRSNNATQAILSAGKAKEIILASFVNLGAVVGYIKETNPKTVTLVALGRLGQKGLEDDLCADAIKNSLEGKAFDFGEMKKKIKKCDCAILVSKVLKKPEDVKFSLELNSYPIVPEVINYSGVKTIVPVNN